MINIGKTKTILESEGFTTTKKTSKKFGRHIVDIEKISKRKAMALETVLFERC